MTARGTDWSLALVVSLLFATGVLDTWFAGDEGEAWVFAAHGIAGAALAMLLVWKLRGSGSAGCRPAAAGTAARSPASLVLGLVAATCCRAGLWQHVRPARTLAGYSVIAVAHRCSAPCSTRGRLLHLGLRAKRPRRRDIVEAAPAARGAPRSAGAG